MSRIQANIDPGEPMDIDQEEAKGAQQQVQEDPVLSQYSCLGPEPPRRLTRAEMDAVTLQFNLNPYLDEPILITQQSAASKSSTNTVLALKSEPGHPSANGAEDTLPATVTPALRELLSKVVDARVTQTVKMEPDAAVARSHSRKQRQCLYPPPTTTPVSLIFPSPNAFTSGRSPFDWENCVDHDTPLNFHFVTSTMNHPSSKVGSLSDNVVYGCSCEGGICIPGSCDCSNEGEAFYDEEGKINKLALRQRYVECCHMCSCKRTPSSHPIDARSSADTSSNRPARGRRSLTKNSTSLSQDRCFNRVVQQGPVRTGLQLVVFKTNDGRGWGLKTLQAIEERSYVCDYIGERIHELLCEARGMRYAKQQIQSYLYTPVSYKSDLVELDEQLLKRQRRKKRKDKGTKSERKHHSDSDGEDVDGNDEEEEPQAAGPAVIQQNIVNEPYSIDALRVGHVARFINHDHEPNLIMVDVMIERRDTRWVHGALFALKRIPAGTELTFNYGVQHEEMEEFKCACASCKRKAKRKQLNSPGVQDALDSTAPAAAAVATSAASSSGTVHVAIPRPSSPQSDSSFSSPCDDSSASSYSEPKRKRKHVDSPESKRRSRSRQSTRGNCAATAVATASTEEVSLEVLEIQQRFANDSDYEVSSEDEDDDDEDWRRQRR